MKGPGLQPQQLHQIPIQHERQYHFNNQVKNKLKNLFPYLLQDYIYSGVFWMHVFFIMYSFH